MGKTPLKYISNSKLKKAYKQSKIITIVQAIVVGIMIIPCVIITLNKGLGIFTFLPLFFLPMVIIGIAQMRQFKAEMKRRNL